MRVVKTVHCVATWDSSCPEFHNKLRSFIYFYTARRISVSIQGCKSVTYVIRLIHLLGGARGSAFGWGTVLQPEGLRFDSHWVVWNFSLTDSFRPHYGSGVDSASTRNEYFVHCRAGKHPHAHADCFKVLSKSVMGDFSLYLLGIFCNIFSVIRYIHWTTAGQKICKCRWFFIGYKMIAPNKLFYFLKIKCKK